jgi:hypothetical protein
MGHIHWKVNKMIPRNARVANLYIKTFLIFTLVTTDVRNGHPHACTDACTCLIFLKTR